MKSNEDLSVSVVVPFYNRSRFLKRLLDSVAAQTLPADKVYIIDNGSSLEETLNAWHIIKTHKLADRCVFTSSIGRGNANFARNLGYELAETKYVAFLDSDDWWEKEHLNKSIHRLMNSNKAGVYSGAIIHTDSEKTVINSIDIEQLDNPFSLIMPPKGHIAQTSSYIVNKSKLTDKVIWSNNLKRHQDYDYFAKIYYDTEGWCYSPCVNVNIDWKDGGTDRKIVHFDSLVSFYRKWNHLFPNEVRERYLRHTLYLSYQANAERSIKEFYHQQLIQNDYINDWRDALKLSGPYIIIRFKVVRALETLNIKEGLKDFISKFK